MLQFLVRSGVDRGDCYLEGVYVGVRVYRLEGLVREVF